MNAHRSLALAAILCAPALSVLADAPKEAAVPRIQIALLLDTSNSMDGLINQAKAELWRVVNDAASAKREGRRPAIEVALYEYGNQGLASEGGFVRMVLPFTNDLDKVSGSLFALTTNGGDEFCGHVIQNASDNLAWSGGKDDLKAIFIAGNEPFTQGPTDYRKACAAAIAKGIVVNTIFCGDPAEGVNTKWKDGAVLADGEFLNINQNRVVVDVKAPQDAEIARLNGALNDTYLAFGAYGKEGKEQQEAQDSNASRTANNSFSARAACKIQGWSYTNDRWDLVDACNNGKAKVEDLKEEELPEEMRKMTVEERKAHVQKKNEERQKVQKELEGLIAARGKFVAEETKKAAKDAGDTLDKALINCIRSQGGRKNFQW